LYFIVQIRWKHEIGRFKCLNTKFFDGLLSNATLFASLLAGDIVVCLHASVERIPSDYLAKFSTVVIDGRYPSGYKSSRPRGSASDDACCAPSQFASGAWWTKLALATSNDDLPRRLLIESSYRDEAPLYLWNLPSRQYLEVLSLRMAFVLGAKYFKSTLFPLGKAILSWARHRIKSSSRSGSKFHQVTALLVDHSKPLIYAMGITTNFLEEDVLQSDKQSYEIRRCNMTSIERLAYTQAYRQSRSFLARTLNVREKSAFTNVAAALLLLRRHCTHPDIDRALRSARLQVSANDNDVVALNDTDRLRVTYVSARSPSQRNLDFAFRILSESSKLCHMVSILLAELGVEATCDASNIIAVLSQDTDIFRLMNIPQDKRKKVAIIAALPEVQLLVSALLNSIGVDHEVLVKATQYSSASMQSHTSSVAPLNWIQTQDVLSKFNCSDVETNSTVNVVITSLPTVAGEHGGLGVEAAGTVLVLDEDWSGREEILLRSLLCRCSSKMTYEGKAFRALRLVAEGTCEDVFLSSENMSLKNVPNTISVPPRMLSWPTTPFGTLSINDFESLTRLLLNERVAGRTSKSVGSIFGFPGRNVLSYCSQILDDVIGSSRLPQHLCSPCGSGIFLPFLSEDKASDIEAMIIWNLVQKEESFRLFHNPSARCQALSITISPVLPQVHTQGILAQMENATLPPLPLRVFLRRCYDKLLVQDTGPGVVLSNNLTPLCRIDHIGETMDRVGRDVPLTHGRSPGNAAFSVLFYTNSDRSPTVAKPDPIRANLYSSCFSSANAEAALHDGNQGSEALVYFPPIFPMIQECAAVANSEQAVEKSLSVESNTYTSVVEVVQIAVKDSIQNDDASDLVNLYDDYGLAGTGAIPLPIDSAYASSRKITRQGNPNAASLLNDWSAATPLVDAGECQAVEKGIGSINISRSMIVLFSRKRRRSQFNTFQFGRPNIGSWHGLPSTKHDAALYADLNGAGKKGKKPVSAFSQLPSAESAPLRQPTATVLRKDDYRHRLLSTLRQSGLGTTIFEAPIFRVASLRIRSKVADRILRESWTSGPTFEAIPGLVLTSMYHSSGTGNPENLNADPRTWTNIANSLSTKDHALSTDTHELSLRQVEFFRRSHVGPQRVDFGPFQCGFISSSDASIVPMKPRIGVSLPMGVKISLLSKQQARLSWDDQSDSILQRSVQRFGQNWILVAKVLSGFQSVSSQQTGAGKSGLQRRFISAGRRSSGHILTH
jgi:hypothetical protein